MDYTKYFDARVRKPNRTTVTTPVTPMLMRLLTTMWRLHVVLTNQTGVKGPGAAPTLAHIITLPSPTTNAITVTSSVRHSLIKATNNGRNTGVTYTM